MIKKFFKKIDGFMKKSYTKLFKQSLITKPAPKKRGRPKKKK
jgi:hypothetical protein